MPRACGITRRPCPSRSRSPLSVALSVRSLSPFPFAPSPYLPPFASVRRAVYPRYFLSPLPRSFLFPSSSSRSHYFAPSVRFLPLAHPFPRQVLSFPPSSRVHSFHRCFRPPVLLVAPSPPPHFFPLRFLSRAASPFCSVSFVPFRIFPAFTSFTCRPSLPRPPRSRCRLFFALILSSPNIRHPFSFLTPFLLYPRPTDSLAHRASSATIRAFVVRHYFAGTLLTVTSQNDKLICSRSNDGRERFHGVPVTSLRQEEHPEMSITMHNCRAEK